MLDTEVAPAAELLADLAYLRPAVGIPARGAHHLFAVSTTVSRTAEGAWVVHEDAVDVPRGAGLTLELRRVLSRSAPSLYRSTEMRRLHPFFDTLRTSFHQRTRAEGRAGRPVVLLEDAEEPLAAFDHSWLANLLGAPTVSVGDLRAGAGAVTLRLCRRGEEGDERKDRGGERTHGRELHRAPLRKGEALYLRLR